MDEKPPNDCPINILYVRRFKVVEISIDSMLRCDFGTPTFSYMFTATCPDQRARKTRRICRTSTPNNRTWQFGVICRDFYYLLNFNTSSWWFFEVLYKINFYMIYDTEVQWFCRFRYRVTGFLYQRLLHTWSFDSVTVPCCDSVKFFKSLK